MYAFWINTKVYVEQHLISFCVCCVGNIHTDLSMGCETYWNIFKDLMQKHEY